MYSNILITVFIIYLRSIEKQLIYSNNIIFDQNYSINYLDIFRFIDFFLFIFSCCTNKNSAIIVKF